MTSGASVPAQVVEHLGGAGEGLFGVDDPGLAAEHGEPRREGVRRAQGRGGSSKAELAGRKRAPGGGPGACRGGPGRARELEEEAGRAGIQRERSQARALASVSGGFA